MGPPSGTSGSDSRGGRWFGITGPHGSGRRSYRDPPRRVLASRARCQEVCAQVELPNQVQVRSDCEAVSLDRRTAIGRIGRPSGSPRVHRLRPLPSGRVPVRATSAYHRALALGMRLPVG